MIDSMIARLVREKLPGMDKPRFHHQLNATVVVILSLVLTACSIWNSPTPTPLPSPSPTLRAAATAIPTPTDTVVSGTVSIWHALDEQQFPWLLNAIAEFQSQYPNVQFDVSFIPALDLKTSFEVASSEGRQPMILIGPGSWGPEFFDLGWLADLSGLASAELTGNLNPAALGAAQYDGALIGLPLHIQGVVLYRNSSIIIEQANTLEKMLSMARQATRDDVRGAYLERSFFYSGGHLFGLGGRLMDENGYPAFNDEFGLEWIDLLREFELMGPTEFFGDNDLQAFTENRAGYIIESTRIRSSLRDALGTMNIAIDPWPIMDKGMLSGYVESENIYLTPRALEQPRMPAWSFVESLFSAEIVTELAVAGMIPSVRASVALAPGSGISITDDLTKEAMVALEDGTTYPVVPEMVYYPPQMNIALQSIFFDNVEANEALQAAAEVIRESITSMQSTPTSQP
jgi:maltose-binding protein MalE